MSSKISGKNTSISVFRSSVGRRACRRNEVKIGSYSAKFRNKTSLFPKPAFIKREGHVVK